MKPILPFWLALILVLPATAAAEGLRYVKLTIFGMDCAPCAYGVEKSLKKLPGVRTVKVSLNDGYAEVTLADGASTSLAQIRKTILDSGFTPKQAHVRIEGTLQPGPRLMLRAGGHDYPLRHSGTASGNVVVSGTVAADAEAVQVEKID